MKDCHGGDIYRHHVELDFSVNLNPLGMPENVKEALVSQIERYETYPDCRSERLREALAQKEQVPVETVICGNGATELIYQLVLSVKPRKALILAPAFGEYESALAAVECNVEHFVLKEKNGFGFCGGEEKEFLKELTKPYDMLFLASPSNPCGITLKHDLIDEICCICGENKTLVVLDECFVEFTLQESFAQAVHRYRGLFILKSFTKNYSMAGLRLGYGICADETVLEKMRNVSPCWNVSAAAQTAGEAALMNGDYMEKTRQYLQKERNFLKENMVKLGFNIIYGEANYLFFKGIPDLKERMLAKGILIRGCDDYYGVPSGYYRIAVKSHSDNMRLIKCFKEIVNG
ncbi:MAG: aminotransferase class I/II-fold pyridoxal phosphate-dependent enzyme [Alistipes sp.]|nr:aminotransferase class I/II-fold pyridoxal phosphate-dependent enzyme [Alistipes sp.]